MGEKIENGTYVREYFQVPAYIGRRVHYRGTPGVIRRFDLAYLVVELDHDPLEGEPEQVVVHPTWEVTYPPEEDTSNESYEPKHTSAIESEWGEAAA